MRRERPARVAWLAGVCSVLIALLTALLIVGGCSGSGGGETDRPVTADPAATEPEETAETGTPGVSDDRVLFGQSAAFSGPAQELGKNMRLGIEAAFHEVNQAGGVHGRMLELTSLDDAYEPEAAVANTQRLIGEGVFALIGAVGTPTSRSATPIAAEAGVPYIAPFTGAAFLRDPEWAEHHQPAGFLRAGDRGDGRAADCRLGYRANRHPLPGRFLRPQRLRRCAGRAGAPRQHGRSRWALHQEHFGESRRRCSTCRRAIPRR